MGSFVKNVQVTPVRGKVLTLGEVMNALAPVNSEDVLKEIAKAANDSMTAPLAEKVGQDLARLMSFIKESSQE